MTTERRAKPQILIVDDEAELADVMAEALTIHGFEVQVATEGTMALFKSENQTFDCIITDVNMPRLTGDKLIECIRARKTNVKTKIIVVSGDINKSVLARILKLPGPPTKILVKPFDVNELVKILLNMDEIKQVLALAGQKSAA
jgi:DNA-binding response OmpR family regulator